MSSTTTSNGPAGQAQGATDQAKEKAQQAAGEARGRLREQVDQRSTQAGQQVKSSADDARQVAQQLREQGKEQPAKLAEQAADRAERLGGYLESSDADRILGDIEDFGRRQPMAVMFGGLALGFAASRFLKASSERRQASSPAYGNRPSHPAQPAPVTADVRNTGTTRGDLGGDTPPVPVRPATPATPGAVDPDVSLSGGVQPVRRSP